MPSAMKDYGVEPTVKKRLLKTLDEARGGELMMYRAPTRNLSTSLDDVSITMKKEVRKGRIKEIKKAFAPTYFSDSVAVSSCFSPRHALVLEMQNSEKAIFWICFSCRNFSFDRSGRSEDFVIPPPPWMDALKAVFLEAGFPMKHADEQ